MFLIRISGITIWLMGILILGGKTLRPLDLPSMLKCPAAKLADKALAHKCW